MDEVLWDDENDGRALCPDLRHRRASDPTSSRSPTRRRHGHSSASSSEDDGVENLPDRFDAQGRLLDGRDHQSGWTTRRGTFHRERGRPGGWDVQGAWQVSGTDGEAVDRLVRNFTGALDGQKSWMGVLGDVLGSGLLSVTEGYDGRRRIDEGDGRRRRR